MGLDFVEKALKQYGSPVHGAFPAGFDHRCGDKDSLKSQTDMAVKIRLRREGTKGRPYYKIVVADGRAPKEGRYIEVIGKYDPMQENDNCTLDLEKAEQWIGNGAQPSETVNSLIKKARRAATA